MGDRFGAAVKTDNGYVIAAPRFKLETPGEEVQQAFTWVGPTVGRVVVALIQNYEHKREEVNGKTFHAVTANVPYEELARLLEKCTFAFLLNV